LRSKSGSGEVDRLPRPSHLNCGHLRRTAFAAGATTSVTPDEALARLKAGNEKYVTAPQVCAVDLLKHREDVAKGQTPWAVILTCSDSRVPPELLFGGLGVGELFVARNAGNMADTAPWARSNTASSISAFRS
jgi:hypothetical protein